MTRTIKGDPLNELLELERSRFHLLEAKRNLLEAADRLLTPLPEFSRADAAIMEALTRVREMFDEQYQHVSEVISANGN